MQHDSTAHWQTNQDTTNPFLRRDFTEALDHVENDMMQFLRSGNLPEEPLSWSEVREDLIRQGATVAELDAEREQYREAMRDLRVKLASFLLATEHLGVPVATVTATIKTVRVKHALPEVV